MFYIGLVSLGLGLMAMPFCTKEGLIALVFGVAVVSITSVKIWKQIVEDEHNDR
jgi:hypothetical protein